MKILLIGGNQGLGRAIYDKLVTDHEVVSLSRKSEIPLNLCWSESKIKESVKLALKQLGGLDSLVISSGMGAYYRPLVSQDEVTNMMQVNFIGPTTVFKACLKHLLRSQGRAMFVTSTVARKPGSGGLSYYAASKGAMHSWVISESRRMAKKGISVFALCPGWFDSPMTSEINPIAKTASTKAIPFGRFGNTDEISNFAIDLLSQSNWVTSGSIFEASGGA